MRSAHLNDNQHSKTILETQIESRKGRERIRWPIFSTMTFMVVFRGGGFRRKAINDLKRFALYSRSWPRPVLSKALVPVLSWYYLPDFRYNAPAKGVGRQKIKKNQRMLCETKILTQRFELKIHVTKCAGGVESTNCCFKTLENYKGSKKGWRGGGQ